MTQLKTVEDCIPYAGWPNHSLYDAKSLALHSRIARNISKDPELLDKARKYLRRRRDNYDPDALPPFIEKWERLLARPAQELAAFLVAVTDDAVSLRHFSPFAGVLTEEERLNILDAFIQEIRRLTRDVIDINPDIMSGAPLFRRNPGACAAPCQTIWRGDTPCLIFWSTSPPSAVNRPSRLLDLAAETQMADAGYEPLKNKQQEERPDNAASSIINIDPEIVSGTPVFMGTRVPVRTLTDNLVWGYGLDYILENFPSVSREQADAVYRAGAEADRIRASASLGDPIDAAYFRRQCVRC